MVAARDGFVELTKLFIARGADVDAIPTVGFACIRLFEPLSLTTQTISGGPLHRYHESR